MAELDKQQPKTQEYYGNYPNFRIASGIKIPDGDLKGEYVDYSVTTDNLQGMAWYKNCLLYTSPSPRDRTRYRMPSSA